MEDGFDLESDVIDLDLANCELFYDGVGSSDSTRSSQPATRPIRRKHRNSKLGCRECKKRRIKCDETLPECINCRNRKRRRSETRCSYLELAKDEFTRVERLIAQKRDLEMNEARKNKNDVDVVAAPQIVNPGGFFDMRGHEIPMIPHRTVLAASLWTPIVGMKGVRNAEALFSRLAQNAMQDWYMSSVCLMALAVHAIIHSFKRKIQLQMKFPSPEQHCDQYDLLQREMMALSTIATRLKMSLISYVREIILLFLTSRTVIANEFMGSRLLLASYCLQNIEVYTNFQRDDKHHIAMIDMCLEIYKHDGRQNIARTVQYVWKTFPYMLDFLHIPIYSSGPLHELIEVFQEFKPFIESSQDHELLYHFEETYSFLVYLTNLLPGKEGAIPFLPDVAYEVFRRWVLLIPPGAFSIDASMTGVQRVFYTFFHSIPAYLCNLLPSITFVVHRQLYGPVALYPFSLKSVLQNLERELVTFAEFSVRLLAFMERRICCFHNFFAIENPLPPDVADYRFNSRIASNVKEDFIESFRNTLIEWRHYPSLSDSRTNIQSLSEENRFMFKVRDAVSSRMEQLVEAKTSNPNRLFYSNVQESSKIIDQTLDGTSDLFPSGFTKVSKIPSTFKYKSSNSFVINEVGLFDQDHDIGDILENLPPPVLFNTPTVEFVMDYKIDRISLLTKS